MKSTKKMYIGDDEITFSKLITKDNQTSASLSWSGAKSKQELDSKALASQVTDLQSAYQVCVNGTPSKASTSVLGTQATFSLRNVSNGKGDLYITTK